MKSLFRDLDRYDIPSECGYSKVRHSFSCYADLSENRLLGCAAQKQASTSYADAHIFQPELRPKKAEFSCLPDLTDVGLNLF